MDATRKHELLAQAKSNRVSNIPIVESETAPNTIHCIWLKEGVMYAFENGQWEAITGEGGGGGGGIIKLPVQFDTIETTGGGDDPQEPMLNVNPTRGNAKGPSTVYYCKQKVSGDLFGPTENEIFMDLAYYDGGGDPKGGDEKAIKSDLDDVFHQYYSFQKGTPVENMALSQTVLQALGLDDDSSAKILMQWSTLDEDDNFGVAVLSIIYKGSNYLYLMDMTNPVLSQYYNNPNFRGITIMESENGGDDNDAPIVEAW